MRAGRKEGTGDANGSKVSSDRMLEAITKDKYAIGIAALMHVNGSCVQPDGSKCASYPNVKVLPLSKSPSGPAVPLNADTVADRTYPLVRDAYVYVNKPPGRPLDPKVREFMRFVLSREGQEIILKNGPYTNLPREYLAMQLKKLD